MGIKMIGKYEEIFEALTTRVNRSVGVANSQ